MTVGLSPQLTAVLPEDTASTWEITADILPEGIYLVGGTAVAAHLFHRISRDLDLFFEGDAPPFDQVISLFEQHARVVVTARNDRKVDMLVSRTKVQLLRPNGHHRIERITAVEGLPVAGMGDLLAMKLQVVVDRPELRDYYDLLAIERWGYRYAEEGLALFVERFRPDVPDQAISTIVTYLADLSDVAQDPTLPMTVEEIETYWHRRVRQIVGHLGRDD